MKNLFLVACFFWSITLPAFSFTNTAEEKTATVFETIKNNPGKLLVFLQDMPKGGDLHNHLGGASMAEYMLGYAKQDHLCLNRTELTVTNGICPAEDYLEQNTNDSSLYNALVDAWSMRNFVPGKQSGHDHFFATFGKYLPITSLHNANILAEVSDRAGYQHEIYLELMTTPDNNASGQLGKTVGWNADLVALRKKLLASGLNDIIQNLSKTVDADEKKYLQLLQCGTQQAKPGCGVTIRYLYQILREQPPEQVFAQLLTGFEVATRDPRFVGINMVQPEDGQISMRDYDLHMKMVGFLHSLYPNVHISLHAGELTPGLVPPEGLRSHIYSAVNTAHAERIGHGVDIAYENHAETLLKQMAAQHVMVEINLKSNESILGIQGNNHPLPLYLDYQVPVALSTDDEGVLRTDLTEQFKMAALTYHFSYSTLKNLIRNSLYYNFLPGKNLWVDANYQQVNAACNEDTTSADKLSINCQNFLNHNEKAKLQWQLEKQFSVFEKKF